MCGRFVLQGFVINLGTFSSKLQDVFESFHDQDLIFTEEKTTVGAIMMKCLYHCCFKPV